MIPINRFLRFVEVSPKLPIFFNSMMEFSQKTMADSSLSVESLVGKGSFGAVYRGVWNGVVVAIKQLHREALSNDFLQEFDKEAQILLRCRHPNIVQLFAYHLQDKCVLVYEYMDKGSLFQILANAKLVTLFCSLKH